MIMGGEIMACSMCGGAGRVTIRFPDGREWQTVCLACEEEEMSWEEWWEREELEDDLF